MVANINDLTESDDDPSFTADGLELFFNSDRGGENDVWTSTRVLDTDPWGTPSNVVEVNTVGSDPNPVVAPDGLTLWLAGRRDGQASNDRDMYVSTRLNRQSTWSTPTLATGLNEVGVTEYAGSTTADGLTFIFERENDLFIATRSSTTSPWATPLAVTELNTVDNERQAWIGPLGLTLYYDSNAGATVDLLVTTRASIASTWETPTPITELNTDTEDESDAWLSPDQRYMMFSKAVAGGVSNIYETSR
jgi:hypothetical protein